MAAPAIYERLRTTGYPWKRLNDRYKNGQPKVSPNSFQYALRYTLNGIRCFQTYKTVEELTVALGRVPTKRFIDVGHLRLPVSKEEFRTGSIPSGAT